MTDPAHPGRMLFVNMPVADVGRSKAFFAKLGFSYHPLMTDAFMGLLGDVVVGDPPMSSAGWTGLPGRTPSSHRLEAHHDRSRTRRPHAVREHPRS